ncbi:MAG: glycosyltransferase [archaeon]
MNMKIGWFTETYYPQMNGVVSSIQKTGAELVKRGHEIHLFCPKTSVKNSIFKIHEAFSFTFPPYPEFKVGIPLKMDCPKMDLVHTHGPFFMGRYGVKIAKKQKIPKISTFHTLLSDYVEYITPIGKRFARFLTWKYCEMHYSKYDKLIVPSKALEKVLGERVKRPISVVPTGVDLSFFKPVENAREKLGLPEDKKIFLSVGRLSYEKNIDVLIKAMEKIEDGLLLIGGRGPAENYLKECINKCNVSEKVKLLGFIDQKDLPAYYSAADFFLIASLSETQAIVVLEAMACGTPVIGVNYLAIPEFIQNGVNGFTFNPNSVEDLADKMNEKCTPTMRRKALETAQNYSIEKCTDILEKIYEELVNAKTT